MVAYKRYTHCLILEKEGKTSTYQMKWRDAWAQKQVAQEEPNYVTVSDTNWSYDTYMIRPRAYAEFERACNVRQELEMKKQLRNYDSDGPEDVDYSNDY